MSTFVICLVVGGSIAIVMMTVRAETEADQPATVDRQPDRGPKHRREPPAPIASTVALEEAMHASFPPPIVAGMETTTVARRVRSGLMLAVLLTALGAIGALAVGVLTVALLTGLRQAVG